MICCARKFNSYILLALASALFAVPKVMLAANAPADLQKNSPGANVAGPVSLLSNYEFWLTICVLIFGATNLVWSSSVIKSSRDHSSENIIKVISVNLIIVGTLVTITAGLSDKQIAPAFGLFGTIAGYLLGRSDRAAAKNTESPPDLKDEKS